MDYRYNICDKTKKIRKYIELILRKKIKGIYNGDEQGLIFIL